MPKYFYFSYSRSIFAKKRMNREKKLSTLEKNIQEAVTAYKDIIEKWLSEVEAPLSLYDKSKNQAGIKILMAEEDTINILILDMIKFDKSTGNILVHQSFEESEDNSRWIPVSILGDKAIEIYQSIFWLDKDDLIIVDGDTHSGTANMVWSFSSKALFFINVDGHIVDTGWYYDGIDHFIGCNGEFAVHKYDWSIAMREIDEHEEEMEEYDD